ncbi:MAG: hypothetical protein NVSMB52_12300 [Chloroflexota bacterium]
MLQRLSILFRGPGVLVLILIAAVAATASYRHTHATHTAGATIAASPIAEATATARPNQTPGVTPTLQATTTTIPPPRYFLSVLTHATAASPATGMQASLRQGSVKPAGLHGNVPTRGRLWLLLEITFRNRGKESGRVTHDSFYAVDGGTGETYTASVRDRDVRILDSQTVKKGKYTSRWIGFDIPRRTASFGIYWNDSNRLVPPEQLARIRIYSASH